jgi:hypothetical protein
LFAPIAAVSRTAPAGVLCDPKVVDRESLNLRFGLHTQARAEREIYAAWSQEPWCTAQGPVVFD